MNLQTNVLILKRLEDLKQSIRISLGRTPNKIVYVTAENSPPLPAAKPAKLSLPLAFSFRALL